MSHSATRGPRGVATALAPGLRQDSRHPAGAAEVLDFTLALPAGYRSAPILNFHARDDQALAERVGPDSLTKALMVNGVPVALAIEIEPDQARCRVVADSRLRPSDAEECTAIARRLLGLAIDPTPFEAMASGDALLGPLVARQAGLRIAQASGLFEALSWAIIGQQINLRFAITLRRAVIGLCAVPHSSGLFCYPDAARVAGLDLDALGAARFSRAKAQALLSVARLARSGELPLARWQDAPGEDMIPALLSVKGIGPWTVNYSLLRGAGFADCSLHGDVAIRRALQLCLALAQRPTEQDAQRLLAAYQPHRSLTAAHLWESLRLPA